MKLSTLLTDIAVTRRTGLAETEIAGLHYDSRRVGAGDLFFALPGAKCDGHDFIAQAVAAGAAAVVAERLPALPAAVAGIETGNARRALALAARNQCGDPAAELTTVGITGTNGKTTISYLLESILADAGRRPAVLGTVNYRLGGVVSPSLHTTPEPVELMSLLRDFRNQGADSLLMEVSSHALHQYRVDGIGFDVAVFTNLTPEHLDYHDSMEDYFVSKRRLFTELLRAGGRAVLNIDDAWGQRLAGELPGALTVGRAAGAWLRPLAVEQDRTGTRCTLAAEGRQWQLTSPLVGDYNLSNLLCAFGAALALGLDSAGAIASLGRAAGAPGRLERIENNLDALVLVDYAHTGDALEQVLTTLRKLSPQRLITVFGCGGDRDRTKRPVMGRVAGRHSDLVLVTSDNPRTEDPHSILEQIRPGVEEFLPSLTQYAPGARGYLVIADRRQAIRQAVALLQPGDVLLVAGKGHEDYQILGTERIHFDDCEELRLALATGGADAS